MYQSKCSNESNAHAFFKKKISLARPKHRNPLECKSLVMHFEKSRFFQRCVAILYLFLRKFSFPATKTQIQVMFKSFFGDFFPSHSSEVVFLNIIFCNYFIYFFWGQSVISIVMNDSVSHPPF